MTTSEQLHDWEVRSLELCYEIEKLPASTQQTNVSIEASKLHHDINQVSVEYDRKNGTVTIEPFDDKEIQSMLHPIKSDILPCPFCGTAASSSITGKFAKCANEKCFLGDPGFFIETSIWNKRCNNENK